MNLYTKTAVNMHKFQSNPNKSSSFRSSNNLARIVAIFLVYMQMLLLRKECKRTKRRPSKFKQKTTFQQCIKITIAALTSCKKACWPAQFQIIKTHGLAYRGPWTVLLIYEKTNGNRTSSEKPSLPKTCVSRWRSKRRKKITLEE